MHTWMQYMYWLIMIANLFSITMIFGNTDETAGECGRTTALLLLMLATSVRYLPFLVSLPLLVKISVIHMGLIWLEVIE